MNYNNTNLATQEDLERLKQQVLENGKYTLRKAEEKRQKYFDSEFKPLFADIDKKEVTAKEIAETKEFLRFWYEDNINLLLSLNVRSKQGRLEQNMTSLNVLLNNLDYFLSLKTDVYTSLNMFYKPTRTQDVCYVLNGIVLDLDYLHGENEYKNFTKADLFYSFWDNYINAGILPPPTAIRFTGRGLTIWYKVKNQNAKYKRYFYKYIQQVIYNKLNLKIMDSKTFDLSRITRTQNTYNIKGNNIAENLYFNKSIVYNNLEELLKDIDIEEYNRCISKREAFKNKLNSTDRVKVETTTPTTETAETINVTVKISKGTNLEKRLQAFKLMSTKKYEDIETLVTLRKGKDMQGYRSILLLYYACSILYASSKPFDFAVMEMCDKVNKINEIVQQEDIEVDFVIYSAIESYKKFLNKKLITLKANGKRFEYNGYHYSNARIINELSITIDEMVQLKVLKTGKKANKKEFNEIERIKKSLERGKNLDEAKVTKRDKLYQEYLVIKEKQKEGLNNTQIAKTLEIERTKISRLLKKYDVN
ncbi:hypothetical protein IAI10_23100 [Clostridium sp. 19966]|uniref:hypothetical protein n=1 Tax=Clostridium sp. 19966 TaxID=2768166 RepID=UPI0028DD84B5|nr:hypothetical protein [Clostridium sp. 19966]MDT8719537.1 hypothetical protein [Clostridium sp. 19966]